jgi:hypothetical protein
MRIELMRRDFVPDSVATCVLELAESYREVRERPHRCARALDRLSQTRRSPLDEARCSEVLQLQGGF